MDIYKDEVAFWEGVVLNYIYSNFTATTQPQAFVDVAWLADNMVLERRKRNFIEESDVAVN